MAKGCGNISPDIAAHLLIPSAESIVFAQESLGLRVYHARENCNVISDVLALNIVHGEKFVLVVLVHPFENASFHHQETGGDVQHLDEPIDGRFVRTDVDVEVEAHLANVLGGTGGSSALRAPN